MAFLTSICRAIYGDELRPVEVQFQHPEPPSKHDYDTFFRCSVRFDSEASAILFARADLDRPSSAPNRVLARASDHVLEDFLRSLQENDLVPRVKAVIAKQLPSGSPRDTMVAEALFLTRRTLQRKLAAQKTSYGEILDSVRRELAEEYLADLSLSCTEISFLVGFSGTPAFSRAFKRWTGKTPREVRETETA